MTTAHSGLMFDIIATEDIFPGDEVFLDYGPTWEKAWREHVAKWTPVTDNNYVHPDVFNSLYKTSRVRTIREQKIKPYPDNLQTACYYDYNDDDVRTIREQKIKPYPDNLQTACYYDYDDEEDEDEEEKDEDGKEESGGVVKVKWDYINDVEDYNQDDLRPCDIMKRYQVKVEGKNNETSKWGIHYTARIYDHIESDSMIPEDQTHIVTHIPRSAIEFVHKEHSSDVYLRNTFRQHISIPDDMFPTVW
eukprot:CAMPEP_0172520076 /NCGR_PEP_ID=MMETSP1066-20121228/291791_1 /TAXON_ID=671091 /ORGANISM="Coscinodiscus wailesii, Strain CCMP2513" /LENGTH=247 /DNA_ID=CAMNT_0013302769 /DNA_START=225 /DNA_END=965 /DNA_ORIENTATION=-